MRRQKPKEETPREVSSQAEGENIRSTTSESIIHSPDVVNEKDAAADKMREAEQQMYELLKPFCCRPRRRLRIGSMQFQGMGSIQLRPAALKSLKETRGKLDLTDLGDAMWDAFQGKTWRHE